MVGDRAGAQGGGGGGGGGPLFAFPHSSLGPQQKSWEKVCFKAMKDGGKR